MKKRAGEMTQGEIEEKIARYESQFDMSSAEFLQQRQEGTAPDTFETMEWMILLKYSTPPRFSLARL